MGKCSVFMLSLCRQIDGQTDRRTKVKQYAPNLSIRGHKKKNNKNEPYSIKRGLNAS